MERGRVILARWPQDGLEEYAMAMLACVISGKAELAIADYALHCQAGDMIYFPAGIPKCNASKPHFLGDTRGRNCTLLWIAPLVSIAGVHCFLCHSRGDRHPPCQANEQCFSYNLFQERLLEGFFEEQQKNGISEVSAETLMLLIRLLKRDIDENAVSPSPFQLPESTAAVEARDPIAQACLYIDSHLELRLTISDVARQVYLSPTMFTRRFREYTGQSFKEYLTERRHAKAVQLLQETDMRMHSVSYFVGLKPGQLRNLFLKKHGCSPAKYRRQFHS
jgi:AraC-like DNA-binding protein